MADRHEIIAILQNAEKRLTALFDSLDVPAKRIRSTEIESIMAKPGFWDNQETALKLVEEMKALRGITEPLSKVKSEVDDLKELLEMAEQENDAAEIAAVMKDIEEVPAAIDSLESMALLSEPADREGCFFSIHTGAGGSDACEWAEMLLRMYTRYFERKKWKVEELSFLAGEEAGIRSVELRVIGAFAFGYTKGELGVHRLVRISPFSGRRETSFAAVDVVPDFKTEVDIEIHEKDLRIDTYRAGGKGGQHVNTTDSAVRITHFPSGLVVAVQNERSQRQNKDVAMKVLKARLYQRAELERLAASDARNSAKSENAWGSQIRNYVMHPYQKVKDVRTAAEVGDIQSVLDGNIDTLVDAYLRWAVDLK